MLQVLLQLRANRQALKDQCVAFDLHESYAVPAFPAHSCTLYAPLITNTHIHIRRFLFISAQTVGPIAPQMLN